jgi:hypothetical protein
MKGWALHLYLIAIFDAQTRNARGSGVDNVRPLLHGSDRQAAWVDLLPTITSTTPRATGMRRQLVRALALLEQEKLVALSGRPGFRGRYNYFRLLSEDSSPGQSWEIAYTIPTSTEISSADPPWIRPPGPAGGRAAAVGLPAEFFTNGWVHVLSATEIATPTQAATVCTQPTPSARRGTASAATCTPPTDSWPHTDSSSVTTARPDAQTERSPGGPGSSCCSRTGSERYQQASRRRHYPPSCEVSRHPCRSAPILDRGQLASWTDDAREPVACRQTPWEVGSARGLHRRRYWSNDR